MAAEFKDEKRTPTLAVSAGDVSDSTAQDKSLLKLKAILMRNKKKEDKQPNKSKEPFVTDKGGKGAPMLTQHSAERILRGDKKQKGKKGSSPHLSSIVDINPITAKPYPGPNNLMGLKALAWNSTVVYSILTYRRHQLTKKNPILVPKGKEPPFKLSILDYTANEVVYLPYLRDSERHALVKIYMKLDPLNVYTRKGKVFRDRKHDVLTRGEIELVEAFEKRHWDFYEKRRNDSKAILEFLQDPDPYFSEESNWQFLLTTILEDLLIIDRGVLVKTRDNEGRLVALTPVDGATIRPIVDENGYITQYAQVVDGHEFVNIYDKNDIVLFRMNLTTDVYRYGYGMPNMEVLSRTVLSDIFIDKGNLDYYRKGGSVPEGFLVVEPPGNTDEGYIQLDKETLDGIQRQLQAIIMSDFTQVPLISGGKFSWIALKGTRKDMQFKELAEYLTRKICAVFQVSPQDVGVIADVNRSTAEAQMSLTRAKGLETLASTISNYFTRGVIDELRPERDLKLWWDEDDAKIAQEKWTVTMQQLNTGVKTINEVRTEQGEDPVPWGDTPFQGLKNWISEEEMMEMQQQQGQAPIPGGGAPGAGAPLPLGSQPSRNPGPQNLGPIPSGQVPGQSLGTPANPATKSLAEIVAEIKERESNPELDTTPLIKAFMEPPAAALDDALTEADADSIVVDMLDVADSVLESIIKKIKIHNSSIYFLAEGWLDRNIVMKVILQLFDSGEDIWLTNVDSREANLTLGNACVMHYEAFNSPMFRLFSQALSLARCPRIWDIKFVTSQEDFDKIHAIELTTEAELKFIKDYAATLDDNMLSEVSYAAVLQPAGLADDIAKVVNYKGPVGPMSYLYEWKAQYGLELSKTTIEIVAEKIKAKLSDMPDSRDAHKFFRRLHTLKGNGDLASGKVYGFLAPGQLFSRLSNVKNDLTDEDKRGAVDVAALMLAFTQIAPEVSYPDNSRIVNTLKLETPWRTSKKDIATALEKAQGFVQELQEKLPTYAELTNFGMIIAAMSENLDSPVDDAFAPYNRLLENLSGFTEVYPNPFEKLRAEFHRALLDLSLLKKQYATALEEAQALVSEGLGVSPESIELEFAGETAESLVDFANALSTGNPELDKQLIPVMRSILLGEEIDPLQKSLAAALLSGGDSEAS